MKKWWLYSLIASVVIIGACGSDSSKPNESESAEKEIESTDESGDVKEVEVEQKEDEIAEEAPTDPKSQIEKIIVGKLKDKTNTDKSRIESVEQLPEEDDSLYFIATLNADENLTTNLIRHGMLSDSKSILEPISKIENLNKIVVNWKLPLVDSSGNTNDVLVMTINLEKESLDKINWENFNVEKFPDVSATYFEHPAIKK